MRTSRVRPLAIATSLGVLMLISLVAHAHAFPQEQEPAVGAEVHTPPTRVRIHFNAHIEPVYSTLVVKDAEDTQVSGESRVDGETLETDVKPLAPGSYHVYWKVVATDGHHTEGDYSFKVTQ